MDDRIAAWKILHDMFQWNSLFVSDDESENGLKTAA
jgi:hypothetical protein